MNTPEADTGTQEAGAGTQPAGTQEAGTGTQAAGDATQPAVAGTQIAGQGAEDRTLVRASDILDSEVVDMNGAMVGTVTDVLVDETGVIQHVVLEAGDFLAGTGDTGTSDDTGAGTPAAGTAAPVGTLDQSTQVVGTIEAVTPEGTAGAGTQAAGTPDAVSTSTVGSGTALPNTGVMADENTVLVFNGTADDLQSQGVMVPEMALGGDSVMIDATGADMPADMTTLDGLMRVSGLTDFNVMNAQDEELGQVEEWIVDVQQGMLEYGVVDFGGFLGIAENSVAVPWEQFNVSALSGATADASLALDVNEDTLENAPQLNMSDWPSWPQAIPMDWETETRTFWETAS
jgi:sporulation protein YlmC with PRC-barrel domain